MEITILYPPDGDASGSQRWTCGGNLVRILGKRIAEEVSERVTSCALSVQVAGDHPPHLAATARQPVACTLHTCTLTEVVNDPRVTSV